MLEGDFCLLDKEPNPRMLHCLVGKSVAGYDNSSYEQTSGTHASRM
jgi:hypothetical protein